MTDPGTVQIEIVPKLLPVFEGEADVRWAKGGRGSGKTMSFAKMTAVRGYMWSKAGISGVIGCGRQHLNSLDESSLAEIKAAIASEPFLAEHYEVGEKYVRTKDRRISYVFFGLNRNITSIKSKAKLLLVWIDEGEEVTETAFSTLLPTLRDEESELWINWNPRRKSAPVEKRFAQSKNPRFKGATVNWRDNPRFPAILERQRLDDLAERPESYDHIWEGAFATAIAGAYFAKSLAAARAANRFGRLAPDPLLRLRAMVDIGGTGQNADAFAMWIVQFIGREVRVIDYYEAVGQPIQAHLLWMQDKERGYTSDRCDIWLPHDGATHDKVYAVSYESALKAAGYDVTVIPNQGKGAAMSRINAARRMFPNCWFGEGTDPGVSAGVEALGWYHEKRDEERDIGLGPEHDWASHGSDAWGLCAVVYEDAVRARIKTTPKKPVAGSARSRWKRGSSAMAA
jgi:phage terminase large subunit